MDFLGIGPLELVLFLLIALVVLGPDDIVKVSRRIGGWLGRMRRSETWESVVKMSDEVRKIPQNLMEEAQIDELKKELDETGNQIKEDLVDIKELNKELNRNREEIERKIGGEVLPKKGKEE